MRRNRITKYIAMLSIAIILILVGASTFMIYYALTPPHRGFNTEQSYREMFERYPYLEQWVDSLNNKQALRDTTIINREGKKLHALYIDSPTASSNTALIIHGYTDNAIRMLMIGYLYNHDLEYNVLLPDLQFHGKSEGEAIQMGWKDRLDMEEWLDLLINKYGEETAIVVHGISMGAATTMMMAGEKQAQQLKCFVADCGYTSVWDEFAQELKIRFGLPTFPILDLSNALCQLKYGWNFKEASSLQAVAKSKLPMFFIHGDADTFVPTWMVYPLFEAKPTPKGLWVVPGVEHADSYYQKKEEYTQRVKEFIAQYMN